MPKVAPSYIAGQQSPRLAHKVALSSGLGIAKQLIALVASVVVARLVGPEVLGTIAYAVAFVALFSSLSDLGFSSAHVKRVSEGRDIGQCMGMIWLAKLVGIVAMGVAVVVSFLIAEGSSFSGLEQVAVFWLTLATAMVGQLSLVPVMTLAAFQDVYRKDLPPAIVQVLNAVLRMGVAAVALGAVGLAAVDLVTNLVLGLIYMWLLRALPIRRPTRATFFSYATFGAPLFVATLLTSVGENIDRVLLHTFAGVSAVGQYSAGLRLGAVLQYLSQAVAGLVFPSLSRAYAEGRTAAAFELCARAERRLALVLLPLLLGLSGIANPLALWLLGERYRDTGPVIVFSTMAMIFQVLAQPHRQVLACAEKMNLFVAVHALQFGVQAGLLYALLSLTASLSGGDGAAPATAAAMAASALLGLLLWHAAVVHYLGGPIDRGTWTHVLSALVLFIPVYSSSLVFDRWSFGSVIVAGVALAGHFLLLRSTGELGPSEIAFVRGLASPHSFRPSLLSTSLPHEHR